MINLQQIFQMANTSNNPIQSMLQMLGNNNPAMKLISGKNPAQLKQIAENMAKERGINLQDFATQLGVRLPK